MPHRIRKRQLEPNWPHCSPAARNAKQYSFSRHKAAPVNMLQPFCPVKMKNDTDK
jgi:hypothetical protein